MGYVIHVWETPVPTSVVEAARIQTELSRRQVGESPTFLSLAQRLTARFPCITTLDDDATDAAWTVGPFDGKTRCAELGIGINVDRLPEILPLIRSESADLGLVVFDPQVGAVWLPGGQVLGQTQCLEVVKQTGPHEKDRLPSAAVVRQRISAFLAPMMERHGFCAAASAVQFKRNMQGCRHEVLVNISRGLPYEIEVQYEVTPKVDAKWVSVLEKSADSAVVDFMRVARTSSLLAIRIPESRSYSLECAVGSFEELDLFLLELSTFLESTVLPKALSCSSVEALERTFNPASPENRIFCAMLNFDILLAYMVDNPDLPSLISQRRASLTSDYQRKLLDDLVAAATTVARARP